MKLSDHDVPDLPEHGQLVFKSRLHGALHPVVGRQRVVLGRDVSVGGDRLRTTLAAQFNLQQAVRLSVVLALTTTVTTGQ